MDRCPHCHAPTEILETGIAAPHESVPAQHKAARLPLELALDNVRSAFNVGSILRSADGAGVQHLYLCGFTPTPDHPRVAKTALGAEASAAWSRVPNALRLVEEIRARGGVVWALESTPNASSLWHVPLPPVLTAERPLLLVAGNEVAGVDPAILRVVEAVVEIPMRGVKDSLNVAIAVGIALALLGERIGQYHAHS